MCPCSLCSHGRPHTTPGSKNGFEFIGFPSILSHQAPANATYPHSTVDDALSELESSRYASNVSHSHKVAKLSDLSKGWPRKISFEDGKLTECNLMIVST